MQGGEVQEGKEQDGEVHDELSFDDGNACVMNSEDERFKYDSALEIVLNNSDDNDEFVYEKMHNLIDYEMLKWALEIKRNTSEKNIRGS